MLMRRWSEGLVLEEKGIVDLLWLQLELEVVLLVLDSTNFSVSLYYSVCRCYGLLLGWTHILLVFTRLILSDVTRELYTLFPFTRLLLYGLT